MIILKFIFDLSCLPQKIPFNAEISIPVSRDLHCNLSFPTGDKEPEIL